MHPETSGKRLWAIIVVASLGYFVDIYDLVVFSVVRTQSLRDIGVPAEGIRNAGMYIINMQMAGLLIGGFLWGYVGDKFGRLKVLFGSIILYSVANIANGFVHDTDLYAAIRLIAGIGLAGELGAGITLVSESMGRHKRGYGTLIVTGIGALGATSAFLVADHFDWRNAYFTGGVMGLLLLLLRAGTFEPGMFRKVTESGVTRGQFFMIFANKERSLRYLYCVCIALPIWYVVGILITQSPEIGTALGSPELLNAGRGIMVCYIGIAIGEVIAGLIAQMARSRRLSLLVFHLLSLAAVFMYLGSRGITPEKFMWLSFAMGFSVGYWASFITVASEQFGTNLRATVTTTAPNLVRAALIPITYLFEFFVAQYGIITAGYIVMAVTTGIALFALANLKESFDKDLDYIEE